MVEELVSFETAKLAKEKGFDVKCTWFYDTENELETTENFIGDTLLEQRKFIEDLILYEVPTQSLLQKWLRELKNNIVLEVNFGVIDDSESAYTWHIREYIHEGVEGTRKKDERDFWKNYDSFISPSGSWFRTYEEALEKGLQRALKLIK